MGKGTHCYNVLGIIYWYYTGAIRLQKMTYIMLDEKIQESF